MVFTVEFPRRLPVDKRGEYWWLETDEAEVRLSNLDKVYWPWDGITKGDLLTYYWNVAPHILPHLSGRPLTLKRMPDGIDGEHFYQKDAPDHTPSWMPRCAVEPEDGKVDEMLMAESAAALLFVVNLGAIEMHPLHSRCESYDRPDYLVFDLDPFEPAGFEEVRVVAAHVRTVLEVLDLDGYPKTSGATGIQVYVPVSGRHTYAETRELAERVGEMIRRADPTHVTMEWSVGRRRGRVFIDHNMNRRAASLASAYSVRPRPAATVSTPLAWDEVESGCLAPDLFTMTTIFDRLAEVGDLFAPVAGPGQDMSSALAGLSIEVAEEDGSEGRVRQVIRGRHASE